MRLATLIAVIIFAGVLVCLRTREGSWRLIHETQAIHDYARVKDKLWVLCDGGTLLVYDPARAAVEGEIATPKLKRWDGGSLQRGLASDGTNVVMASRDQIWRLDPEKGQILAHRRFGVGDPFGVIQGDEGILLVLDFKSARMEVLDLSLQTIKEMPYVTEVPYRPCIWGDCFIVSNYAAGEREWRWIRSDGATGTPREGIPLPDGGDYLVWDWESPGRSAGHWSRAYSGELKRISSTDTENRVLWSSNTAVVPICRSPDGRQLAYALQDKGLLHVIDGRSGKLLLEAPCLGAADPFCGLRFSDDGQWVATVSHEGPDIGRASLPLPRFNTIALTRIQDGLRRDLELDGAFSGVAAWPRDDIITIGVLTYNGLTLRTWRYRGDGWWRYTEALALAVVTLALVAAWLIRRRKTRATSGASH